MEGIEMKIVVVVFLLGYVTAEIRDSIIMNRLTKVKPVGGNLGHKFLALTEIPPPQGLKSGRRHMEEDCSKKYVGEDVYEAGKVLIHGEDYMDNIGKTVATVIFPDHIDRKFFEVTTQVPYLTLGPIEAIGYHPSTKEGDHPAACEKIYQDHMDDQYSDEDMDYSEESLEMARMPLHPDMLPTLSAEAHLDNMYNDFAG